MGKKKLTAIIFALLLSVLVLSACGDGDAASGGDGESVVLRLASDAPLEHIANELNNELAEMIEERTDGRVTIKYHPGSQLGGYETVYEEIMRGSIDAGQIAIPDALDARLGAAYMPYYASSFEEAQILFAPDAFLANEMGKITNEHDIRFAGFLLEGFIASAFVDEPTDIHVLGANKEVQTRSPGMATFSIPQQDLGYIPVSVPYAEVPTAIQTGVVDGWVGGTPNINYSWVGEVINHLYVDYMHAEATSYVISEKTLAKLSDEDAETVVTAFREQSEKSFELAQENEEEYKQKLADDYGVNVVEFTDEQIVAQAEFIRETTWPNLEAELGKEFVDGLRAELENLK